MPRLIERIQNVFDDHLTHPCPAAVARPGSDVPSPISGEELIARSNELTASLLALRHESERGMNEVFARLHELSFELHLTPGPDQFHQAVQFIVQSAEHQSVAAHSDQPVTQLSSVARDGSEHEQLPLSLRLAL